MKPRTISLIEVNSAVFLWGLTLMLPKAIRMGPTGMVFFRSLVSVVVLSIFLKATGGKISVKRPRGYLLMGVLGVILCVHWVTLFAALQMAKAAVVVVALNTYPALTALAEPLAYRKWPRSMDVALAGVVLAGVLIMLPEVSFSNEVTLAIVLAVISGALFAARNIIIRKHASHYGGATLMFWQTLITVVCLLPFVPTAAEVYSPRNIALLAALGAIFTALPQSLYAAGLRHLSAKTVGILSLMQVLYGAIWGYVLFGETVNLRTATGGAIILACIVFETIRDIDSDRTPIRMGDEMAASVH